MLFNRGLSRNDSAQYGESAVRMIRSNPSQYLKEKRNKLHRAKTFMRPTGPPAVPGPRMSEPAPRVAYKGTGNSNPEKDSRSGGDCASAPPCKKAAEQYLRRHRRTKDRRGPDEFAAPHGFAAFAETKAGKKILSFSMQFPYRILLLQSPYFKGGVHALTILLEKKEGHSPDEIGMPPRQNLQNR